MGSTSSSSSLPGVRLTLIAAATQSNGIGASGGLPWKLKGEMAYFRAATSYVPEADSQRGLRNAVVMGRNTWESIPKKFRPLKDRVNIVVSRNGNAQELGIDSSQDAHLVSSLPDALNLLSTNSNASQRVPISRAFLIGGAQLYAQALQGASSDRNTEEQSVTPDVVDRMLVTRVLHPSFDQCDVHLPEYRSRAQIDGDLATGAAAEQGASSRPAESGSEEQKGNDQETWRRSEHEELESFLGKGVEHGIVEEDGVRYEFQMWVRR